jgi:DNA-binding NarL/FixJ family response regulator
MRRETAKPKGMKMPIKTLIVDDHALVREGLRALFDREEDFVLVGEAADGRAAVDAVQKYKPDVVIMDLNMPELNGVDATRLIKAQTPRTKILALGNSTDRHQVTRTLRAGAAGYLPKDCTFSELSRGVRTVLEQGTYLSPAVAGVLVEQISRTEGTKASRLTGREREVVQLLAEGNSTKEAASKLFISVKTVESHRLRVMRKLQLRSLAQLTKFAIREGLTTLEL